MLVIHNVVLVFVVLVLNIVDLMFDTVVSDVVVLIFVAAHIVLRVQPLHILEQAVQTTVRLLAQALKMLAQPENPIVQAVQGRRKAERS